MVDAGDGGGPLSSLPLSPPAPTLWAISAVLELAHCTHDALVVHDAVVLPPFLTLKEL